MRKVIKNYERGKSHGARNEKERRERAGN